MNGDASDKNMESYSVNLRLLEVEANDLAPSRLIFLVIW